MTIHSQPSLVCSK